ncbi:MAG: pilus assembly protein PilP [Pseudomonas sp.]|nr:pilus assembly protein PilP [Pseudomonas sp.]
MMRVLLAMSVLPLLFGCVEGENSDLKQYVSEVISTPRGRVEPIPEFKPYETFSYSAAALRSPFSLPVLETEMDVEESVGNVFPDPDRTKEYLEQFSIGQLAMVGTLQKPQGDLWALIQDGNGGVVRTKQGEYMGQNHGRIVSIMTDRINLIEIVPDGNGGWLERPRTVVLEGLSGE